MNTIIPLKLRVITPVHIGGAQEKHLVKNIDFIQRDKKIYILNHNKLAETLPVHEFANAIAQNNLRNFLENRKVNIAEFAKHIFNAPSGEIGQDIRTQIKNSLSGKPIIPGSSLKGAIRSMIYKQIGGSFHNPPSAVFGNINQDLMRFIKVTDAEFSITQLINTKIFNLKSDQNKIISGWKDSFHNRTSLTFNKIGFTTPLENIVPKDVADCRIVLSLEHLNRARETNLVNYHDSLNGILTSDSSDFLRFIFSKTNEHIEREISFFTKYEGDHTPNILEILTELKKLNSKNAPLIRLGLGSGFHAMTGETLHASHEINGIAMLHGRSRGQLNGRNSAKSRKISFNENANQTFEFFPMGFVQLCTEPYFNEHYQKEYEDFKEEQKVISVENVKETGSLKGEIILPNEAINTKIEEIEIPKIITAEMRPFNYLHKTKFKIIDAIVIGQERPQVLFKPMVEGFENTVFKAQYSSGFPIDTIIQINCCAPNLRSLQFQGPPKIKQ